MAPLVSILIPAYNAEEWVDAALDSALAQTWTRTEIILVDDGSTDRTLQLSRRRASGSVKIVAQTNQGASAARNVALNLAQGDYIQWLDADDVLHPRKIEHQMARVQTGLSRRTLLSSSWGRFYYRLEKARLATNSLWHDLTPTEWIFRKMADNAWMAIETWLISRELTQIAGPWDTTLSADDDGEYLSRVICASDRIVFEPHSVSYVRKANFGSLSGSVRSQREVQSQFTSMTLQIANVQKLHDSERVRSACRQYLQNWFGYFYPEHSEIVLKMQRLALDLGAPLTSPKPSWKYAPIQKMFGWKWSKTMARVVPKVRAWCKRAWDRFMFELTKARREQIARSF